MLTFRQLFIVVAVNFDEVENYLSLTLAFRIITSLFGFVEDSFFQFPCDVIVFFSILRSMRNHAKINFTNSLLKWTSLCGHTLVVEMENIVVPYIYIYCCLLFNLSSLYSFAWSKSWGVWLLPRRFLQT